MSALYRIASAGSSARLSANALKMTRADLITGVTAPAAMHDLDLGANHGWVAAVV
jgi:hypothetical protein